MNSSSSKTGIVGIKRPVSDVSGEPDVLQQRLIKQQLVDKDRIYNEERRKRTAEIDSMPETIFFS